MAGPSGPPGEPEKRGPGRPRGTSPIGNPPGSDGSPLLRFRLTPRDHERVEAAGGTAWAKRVILDALDQLDHEEGEQWEILAQE